MKMQVVTISPQKYGVHEGIRIRRELFDNCGLVDVAFCSIRTVKNGFAASGFPASKNQLLYMRYLILMKPLTTL